MTTPHAGTVTRYRAALEALGRQDIDAMASAYDEGVIAVDHAQQRTLQGLDEFRGWCEEWLAAFPDSRIADLECHGAGDWTIARFAGTGTNHGPMGPMPPTDRPMRAELCAVARWRDGRIVEEHVYYDLYGVLAQLGHVPAMGAPAT